MILAEKLHKYGKLDLHFVPFLKKWYLNLD